MRIVGKYDSIHFHKKKAESSEEMNGLVQEMLKVNMNYTKQLNNCHYSYGTLAQR